MISIESDETSETVSVDTDQAPEEILQENVDVEIDDVEESQKLD